MAVDRLEMPSAFFIYGEGLKVYFPNQPIRPYICKGEFSSDIRSESLNDALNISYEPCSNEGLWKQKKNK